MIDVGVLIQTRLFNRKHGIKSNTSAQEKALSSQHQDLRGHQFTRVGGQLMVQLQRQAFCKAYGKIWDLARVEVSVEAIASLS